MSSPVSSSNTALRISMGNCRLAKSLGVTLSCVTSTHTLYNCFFHDWSEVGAPASCVVHRWQPWWRHHPWRRRQHWRQHRPWISSSLMSWGFKHTILGCIQRRWGWKHRHWGCRQLWKQGHRFECLVLRYCDVPVWRFGGQFRCCCQFRCESTGTALFWGLSRWRLVWYWGVTFGGAVLVVLGKFRENVL